MNRWISNINKSILWTGQYYNINKFILQQVNIININKSILNRWILQY